jgi:O-6-methylguanine DNA methyltransferase
MSSLQKNTRVSNGVKTFTEKVRSIVEKIPEGKTMTYKQVATMAGNPNAARAVGAIMRKNFDAHIPCHRVIGSDGAMRGYNRGGVEQKMTLLRKERALT